MLLHSAGKDGASQLCSLSASMQLFMASLEPTGAALQSAAAQRSFTKRSTQASISSVVMSPHSDVRVQRASPTARLASRLVSKLAASPQAVRAQMAESRKAAVLMVATVSLCETGVKMDRSCATETTVTVALARATAGPRDGWCVHETSVSCTWDRPTAGVIGRQLARPLPAPRH